MHIDSQRWEKVKQTITIPIRYGSGAKAALFCGDSLRLYTVRLLHRTPALSLEWLGVPKQVPLVSKLFHAHRFSTLGKIKKTIAIPIRYSLGAKAALFCGSYLRLYTVRLPGLAPTLSLGRSGIPKQAPLLSNFFHSNTFSDIFLILCKEKKLNFNTFSHSSVWAQACFQCSLSRVRSLTLVQFVETLRDNGKAIKECQNDGQ